MATDDPKTASMPGRYASALFELAKEQNAIAQVEGDLDRFQAMLDESTDLKRLVESPVFKADEQSRALTAVLDQAGVSGLAGNFLRLIANNRRLFAVPQMIAVFRELASRDRGEVPAEVATAEPLTDAQVEALKERLRISIGKEVKLTTKVDPELLGGMVLKVGSRMIDSSLRTKLTTLKMRMKEVG